MKYQTKFLLQFSASVLFIAGIAAWTVLAGMNSFVSADTILKCMGGN